MQGRLDAFIGDMHESPFSFYKLNIIAQWLVSGKLVTKVPLPSQKVLRWLVSVWNTYYDDRLDLMEEFEEASQTRWDTYIKRIMGDTPLSTILLVSAESQIYTQIWDDALKSLTIDELDGMKEFAQQIKTEQNCH